MEKNRDTNKAKVDGILAGVKLMSVQQKAAENIAEAKTDEEKRAAEQALENEMAEGIVGVMWITSVVDITTTLHETVQMVLFDQSVDKDVRKHRAYGLKNLGEIFMACPAEKESGSTGAKQMYEDAAMAAMLETIKRKEEEAHAAV